MSNGDRVRLFQLLAFVTSTLSIAGMILALKSNWQWVAGIAICGCIVYQIRIWLITPLVNKHG